MPCLKITAGSAPVPSIFCQAPGVLATVGEDAADTVAFLSTVPREYTAITCRKWNSSRNRIPPRRCKTGRRPDSIIRETSPRCIGFITQLPTEQALLAGEL